LADSNTNYMSEESTITEIWISTRTDNIAGTGTLADPFDGSTAAKFDALLFSYLYTNNLRVHLVGAEPFLTGVNHQWSLRPGWVISGDGMNTTTIKLVGDLGGINYTLNVISSSADISYDNIILRDFTVDCNWPALAASADTGAGGEKNIALNAVAIWGSNNLIQRVRSINSYGSWANLKEHFDISLLGPQTGDGTNCVIQSCRAEQPWGNYGNPFSISGWVNTAPNHLLTNSKVLSCTAVGVNGGVTGYTSGGVTFGNVKDCYIDSNTFIDCYGAAYTDTGTIDGIQIINNTVIRGWEAVGIRTSVYPKQNILITGNNFSIQNRVDGTTYGIAIDGATTSNLTIKDNTFTCDTSGDGLLQFSGIVVSSLNNAAITDNIVGVTPSGVSNYATGTGILLCNNRDSAGVLIPELASSISCSAVSRRIHGPAGTFDIALPMDTSVGVIECRIGNPQIVFIFPQAVTATSAAVISGVGSVANISGSGSNQIAVNLTGVANAQNLVVALYGIHYGSTTDNVCAHVNILMGDVTASGTVSNTDVSSVKAQVAAPVTASNFRNDINANGFITNTDVNAVRALVGQKLP
jgi:hypothetical protein